MRALLIHGWVNFLPLIFIEPPIIVGGLRPVEVVLPYNYWIPGSGPHPLGMVIHGFSRNSHYMAGMFKLETPFLENGIVYMTPIGIRDGLGYHFWSATDACCDFANQGRDDSKYLSRLIREVQSKVLIDPSRIYLIGHSNGAFMSHRMGCEHSD